MTNKLLMYGGSRIITHADIDVRAHLKRLLEILPLADPSCFLQPMTLLERQLIEQDCLECDLLDDDATSSGEWEHHGSMIGLQ